MKIESKPKRIVAMIAIGVVVAVVLILLGCSQRLTAILTGGILFFAWLWLGGKW